MSVLVTGGSGFLGRHLVGALLQGGHSVRTLSRSPLDAALAPGDLHMRADVNDRAALAKAMAGVATVYHAAAVVPGRGSAAEMWETNVAGTRSVALSCVRAGVGRLVLVSSVAAYRAPLSPVVLESAPTGGTDLYGRSKTQAELTARLVCQGQLELVIARPCQIYGPMDLSGYTQRLLRLTGSPLLPVAGWSGRAFSLIHVSDVADALRAAGEVGNLGGAIFNIAPDSTITLLQLAEIQASLLGNKRRGIRVPIPETAIRAGLSLRWMARNCLQRSGIPFKSYAAGRSHGSLMLGGPCYGSENARARLGFQARTSPEQGVAELIARRSGGSAAAPLTGSKRFSAGGGSP